MKGRKPALSRFRTKNLSGLDHLKSEIGVEVCDE